MTEHDIHDLLLRVARGTIAPEAALERLRTAPGADDLDALVRGIDLDHTRRTRTGLGEAVMGTGKSTEQLIACVGGLARGGEPVLATRVDAEAGRALAEGFPGGVYHGKARLFALGADLGLDEPCRPGAEVMVVTAGTSDMPVALEAVGAARFFGLTCSLAADVGVAGVHRLAKHLPALGAARLVVAVAGNGRRAAQRAGRAHRRARGGGAQLAGLGQPPGGNRGAAGHAQLVLARHHGMQHRQRLRRGCVRGQAAARQRRGLGWPWLWRPSAGARPWPGAA